MCGEATAKPVRTSEIRRNPEKTRGTAKPANPRGNSLKRRETLKPREIRLAPRTWLAGGFRSHLSCGPWDMNWRVSERANHRAAWRACDPSLPNGEP